MASHPPRVSFLYLRTREGEKDGSKRKATPIYWCSIYRPWLIVVVFRRQKDEANNRAEREAVAISLGNYYNTHFSILSM